MSTLIAPTTDSAAFSPRFDVEGVLVVDPLVSSDDIDTLTLRTAEIAAGSVPYPDEVSNVNFDESIWEISPVELNRMLQEEEDTEDIL